jgi:hypothetical protein
MAAELALASSGMMTPFADALRPKLKLSKRFSFHDRESKAPLHAACGGGRALEFGASCSSLFRSL